MNPNLTNSIPLNPAHQIFPTTPKAHLILSEVFSYDLIFSEKIIQYSRTFAPQVQMSWNQAHAPLLVERIPKTPRTQSETSQIGGSHNYKTKQNKLPSFIDR
jgi:hypothetical protein